MEFVTAPFLEERSWVSPIHPTSEPHLVPGLEVVHELIDPKENFTGGSSASSHVTREEAEAWRSEALGSR